MNSSMSLICELQESNRKLAIEKGHYLTIFNSIQQPLIVLNNEFVLTNINNAALDLIAKVSPESNREEAQQNVIIKLLQDELSSFFSEQEQYIIFEKQFNFSYQRVIFKIKLSKIIDQGDKCGGIIISLGDITSRKLMEENLRESEEKYRIIFENTGTATAIIEEDTKVSLVNSQFVRLLGYTKDKVEGKMAITDLFTRDMAEKVLNYHYNRRQNVANAPTSYEATLLDQEGNIKNVIVKVAVLQGTKQSIVSFSDFTARKKAEERLHFLSYHDALTGVNNRRYFEEKLTKMKHDSKVGIIMCDLDGLKFINDTKGHAAGDEMIIAATNIIKSALRENDIISRIGGDEFAILLPKCNLRTVRKVVNRIKLAVANFNQNDPKLEIGISIGFAIKDAYDMKDLKDILTQADDNMYIEKLSKTL